jgi:hypothetical protein
MRLNVAACASYSGKNGSLKGNSGPSNSPKLSRIPTDGASASNKAGEVGLDALEARALELLRRRLRRARLGTAAAFYDSDLGQFIPPYDAVSGARDPDALLLGLLQETYDAAAVRR